MQAIAAVKLGTDSFYRWGVQQLQPCQKNDAAAPQTDALEHLAIRRGAPHGRKLIKAEIRRQIKYAFIQGLRGKSLVQLFCLRR